MESLSFSVHTGTPSKAETAFARGKDARNSYETHFAPDRRKMETYLRVSIPASTTWLSPEAVSMGDTIPHFLLERKTEQSIEWSLYFVLSGFKKS
jgi:hypothetical protein